MRKTLTDKGVAALKPRPLRYAFPDPELRGHFVRVQPSGAPKSFVTVTRDPHGQTNLGDARGSRPAEDRRGAGAGSPRPSSGCGKGCRPWRRQAPGPTLRRSGPRTGCSGTSQAKGLRSAPEIKRLLRNSCSARSGRPALLSLRRGDVAKLLDQIEDNHGARQADTVLAAVRSIMNWSAARHDAYAPPIVRGMRRPNQRRGASGSWPTRKLALPGNKRRPTARSVHCFASRC